MMGRSREIMKEEAFLEKKTNLEITIEALREVEQLKNTPNKKSYSSFAGLLKINTSPLFCRNTSVEKIST